MLRGRSKLYRIANKRFYPLYKQIFIDPEYFFCDFIIDIKKRWSPISCDHAWMQERKLCTTKELKIHSKSNERCDEGDSENPNSKSIILITPRRQTFHQRGLINIPRRGGGGSQPVLHKGSLPARGNHCMKLRSP